MAERKSSFIGMFVVLTIISVISAFLLASTNSLTQKDISIVQKKKQLSAIQQVVPSFDNNPILEKVSILKGKNSLFLFPAKENGELVGMAVETFSDNGFSGSIRLMVGFDLKGNVVDYTILQHSETPGLGSKMKDWFRSEKEGQNILRSNPSKRRFFVSKDGGEVDGITAATISSRAFLEAVREAHNQYITYLKDTKK